MAERTSSQKRQKRSDSREERRSLATKPFEALDEAAETDEGKSVTHSALKHAAVTAAAGAVAAGIAGAAKALSDRREGSEHRAEGDQAAPEREPPQAEAQPEEVEAETPEQPEEPEDEPARAQDEPESSQDEPESPRDEPEGDDEGDDKASRPQGASAEETTEIVEEAKRRLEELLGREPERVSGFGHSNGRWTVMLEVLEVRRVPETTDVLSSYEVAFDDDRNLVSVSEVRRYRRSQIEEGR
jgi:hypothetical protein